MIRLDPHRYDGFKDIYFNTAFKVIRGLRIRENLHYLGKKYAPARELVWYLRDYDLYPCLTWEGTGFEDLPPSKIFESGIEDMTEDELKDALRPLILGTVETLRKARELLLVTQEKVEGKTVRQYKTYRNFSRAIQDVLKEQKLLYDADNKALCTDSHSGALLLDYIPYEDEKILRDELIKISDTLDDGRRKIFELLKGRWNFLEYLYDHAYKSLTQKEPECDSLPWKNMHVPACLVKLLELRSCPYCNKNFIGTVRGKNLGYQLDHYINKSMYPFFCVSLYNLVPSCNVCNHGKGDKDETEVLSPLEKCADYDRDLDFYYGPPLQAKEEKGHMEIAVKPGTGEEMAGRYEKTLEMFDLNTCYRLHTAEADSFIRKMVYYPPSMIAELGRIMTESGNSLFAEQMIEETMFGEGREEAEEYHKQPLSMMYRHLYRKYRE